jgi:alpha,alpha-trehalose-phosphate synthase [UDP-forming]
MPRARKIVVVSNRGPYRREGERWVRSAGGLVAALHPMLSGRGGSWISAKHATDFATVDGEPDVPYQLADVRISEELQQGFYMGMSNAVIWPLLHGFPPTMHVADAPWDKYVTANEKFTEVTAATSEADDLIWIQDYHLMLVPGMLREKMPRSRIGWFCHVPWPPWSLFGILPWREDLLEGLLGADVIGFHTREYVDHFLDSVDHYTDYSVDRVRGTVRLPNRTVRVMPAPIGVSVAALTELAKDPDVVAEAKKIRERVGNRRILLGVDRLDYTKGIPERIRAFKRLLDSDPSLRESLVMLQIMVPSRTDVAAYAELKVQIDQLVGEINGEHGTTGTVPMQYFYRNFQQGPLFAHYEAADVAVLTPLRDGMNLVAHEWVLSRTENTGVLILSEFTGASSFLKGAIQVNPYDIDGIAEAIQQALEMPPDEQARRMKKLRAEVEQLDVHQWADDYLNALEHG